MPDPRSLPPPSTFILPALLPFPVLIAFKEDGLVEDGLRRGERGRGGVGGGEEID
jgi:hypothetical protein